MATLSFRASDESIDGLDKLCTATDRDRTYHLSRALSRYLETELWHIQAVQEGIESANKGEVVPLDDVKDKWLAKRNDRTHPQG